MVPSGRLLDTKVQSPVPTGTDGSRLRVGSYGLYKSRPYGDGWFPIPTALIVYVCVPSLRGRMVLRRRPCTRPCRGPVPTGTDGSTGLAEQGRSLLSRPYGDGWFYFLQSGNYIQMVPSLRGRMVLSKTREIAGRPGPVPTGTDGSKFVSKKCKVCGSRPYGDGWF